MTTSILVTGGTGLLGSRVVHHLREADHQVRVLSRQGGEPAPGVEHVRADLRTGEGLSAALADVGTVLHLAGGPKGDDELARTLVPALAAAGVGHVVHISVIGADRVPLGYLRAQRTAERVVEESGVPFTILRAAQFHDFAWKLVAGLARLPVTPVPAGLRMQPVDVDDVAQRLAGLAEGPSAEHVPDLPGPRTYALGELLTDYLRVTGKRRLRVPMPLPGKAGRSYRAGENLAVGPTTAGTRTWEEYVAARRR